MPKKKSHYKKMIAAGALAGVVFSGSQSVSAAEQSPTTYLTEKAHRKERMRSNREHRQESKHNFVKERRIDKVQLRSDVRTALENNNFESFQVLLASHPKAKKITQEQFNILSEAYILQKKGNKQEAKDLLKTLKLTKSLKGTVMGFGFDSYKKEIK